MKYIQDINAIESSVKEKSENEYNKLGEIVCSAKEKTFAKSIQSNDNSNNYYFITIHNNIPYDPYGIYSHREQNLKTSLKKVSKQTFDYYLLYLKTRNLLYMTRTQRSFLNG